MLVAAGMGGTDELAARNDICLATLAGPAEAAACGTFAIDDASTAILPRQIDIGDLGVTLCGVSDNGVRRPGCTKGGCTNPTATNYDPEANRDDGSCSGPGIDPAYFFVVFGPCTVSNGGRCVGRPDGYGPDEMCTIGVGGRGGVLETCNVFDMYGEFDASGNVLEWSDFVTLPGDSVHTESDCPVGMMLAPGDYVRWVSNTIYQGGMGRDLCTDSGCHHHDNGCVAKGLCGLPWTCYGPNNLVPPEQWDVNGHACPNGLGGGWQVCFEDASSGGKGR